MQQYAEHGSEQVLKMCLLVSSHHYLVNYMLGSERSALIAGYGYALSTLIVFMQTLVDGASQTFPDCVFVSFWGSP